MLQFCTRGRDFYKILIRITVPLALQSFATNALAMIGTLMIGYLGQDELAGLSLANTVFFISTLFTFGIQSGSAVLLSQYWGKRDMETINRVLGLSLFFAGIFSFLFTTFIFLFPREVMMLTTNNEVLADIAARYGRIVAYSYFLNTMTMVYVGAQRSTENLKFGLFVITFSAVVNLFLNWVLIFGKFGVAPMGIEGAAYSLLISRILEILVTLVYVFFIDKHLTILPKALFRPGKAISLDFIRYASPVILNETLWGAGMALLPVIFGHMPGSSDILAGYSLTQNVERIMLVAMFGVSNAAAILIGKSIGAGEQDEEVHHLASALLQIAVILGILSGLILVGSSNFLLGLPIFNLSATARQTTLRMFITLGVLMGVRSFNTSMIVGVLRGGGDVRFNLLVDVVPLYLYAVPVVALTGLVLHLDIFWVYLLLCGQEFVKFAVGLPRFLSRKWINNVTRQLV